MTRVKKIKSLKDLTPDDHNANKGTERGKGMIQKSLRAFGAGRSVLADRNGKLSPASSRSRSRWSRAIAPAFSSTPWGRF